MIFVFQVEFLAVTDIKITTSRNSVQAYWAPVDCANQYIIRVKKYVTKNPPVKQQIQIKEGSGHVTALMQGTTDDEDYKIEESGSGKFPVTESVEKINPSKYTLQFEDGSGHVTAFKQRFTDDEDYEKEESGSGEFPVTESVEANIYENIHSKVKNTGFKYGYGNNLTLITASSYDYFDEQYEYVDTHQQTTPMLILSDDNAEVRSGSKENHKENIRASETHHEPDYGYEDFEEEDEGWRKRKKRSAYNDDSSIEVLDEYESNEYMNDIRRILSLDYERENVNSDDNYLFAVVDTNSGEIEGLDPCSSYTLDVQAVYNHNIRINSEEKEFDTLCKVTCDTHDLDFMASIKNNTKKVVIKIESDPDCTTEYALKYCNKQNCQSEHNLKSTNSELIINDTFYPCLEYEFYLMPNFKKGKLTTEGSEWDNARYRLIKFESSHDRPISGVVEMLSHESVNISWLKPNECVDGYRISLYEKRHLPYLQPIYADKNNERLIKSMNLSSSNFSLELSNLASCRLYRAEIKSLYSPERGELLAQMMKFNYFIFYTASDPLLLHFRTLASSEVDKLEPLDSLEIAPIKSNSSEDVVFRFVSSCQEGYYLSLCHFPNGCKTNTFTTYSIHKNEKSEKRGYYEQLVKHLIPCSIFKYELRTMQRNFTLYEDFLYTETRNDYMDLQDELESIISINGKL